MATRAVVTLTEGGKGVGKTFRRGPHFLVNDFLPQRGGTCYTNLPVFRDAIARVMAIRTGRDEAEFIDRIQTIPTAELEKWEQSNKDGTPLSGPWDYFEKIDLVGCHIQIDEMHNYCGAHHHKKHVGRWVEWLGEVRHLGVTVEFISQHVMKMAAPVRREVAVKLYLKTTEDDHDPYFKIKMGDWYELLATLTRTYDVFIVEEESRENRSKWEVVDTRVFRRDPFYFELYDSYAAPVKGGVKGKAQKREFEKRTRLGMLAWFYSRHWFKFTWRVALVAVLIWLLGFGGFQKIFSGIQERMMDRLSPDRNQVEEVTREAPVVVTTAAANAGSFSDPPFGRVEPDQAIERPQGVTAEPAIRQIQGVQQAVHDEVVERVAELEVTVAQLHAEVEKLEAALQRSSAITLLERDRVTFREGYSYGPGEAIDFGVYAGRSVESIDWARRMVKLDDGQILRMGHDRERGVLERVPTPNLGQ